MRRIFFILIVFLTAIIYSFGCGGSGAASSPKGQNGGDDPDPDPDPVVLSDNELSVADLDGVDDVDPSKSFTYVFDNPIDETTATEDSFFITFAVSANISSPLKAAFTSDGCNPENKISATITADSTKATLDPENDLIGGAVYTVCLTTDILYSDASASVVSGFKAEGDANFEGFMATFTVSTDDAVCETSSYCGAGKTCFFGLCRDVADIGIDTLAICEQASNCVAGEVCMPMSINGECGFYCANYSQFTNKSIGYPDCDLENSSCSACDDIYGTVADMDGNGYICIFSEAFACTFGHDDSEICGDDICGDWEITFESCPADCTEDEPSFSIHDDFGAASDPSGNIVVVVNGSDQLVAYLGSFVNGEIVMSETSFAKSLDGTVCEDGGCSTINLDAESVSENVFYVRFIGYEFAADAQLYAVKITKSGSSLTFGDIVQISSGDFMLWGGAMAIGSDYAHFVYTPGSDVPVAYRYLFYRRCALLDLSCGDETQLAEIIPNFTGSSIAVSASGTNVYVYANNEGIFKSRNSGDAFILSEGGFGAFYYESAPDMIFGGERADVVVLIYTGEATNGERRLVYISETAAWGDNGIIQESVPFTAASYTPSMSIGVSGSTLHAVIPRADVILGDILDLYDYSCDISDTILTCEAGTEIAAGTGDPKVIVDPEGNFYVLFEDGDEFYTPLE